MVEDSAMLRNGKNSAPSFDEPLEMLAACHEQIEEKLAAFERLCHYLDMKGNDDAARASADAILRYFGHSGALHSDDEDDDLFPLLRVRAAEQRRDEIAAAIEELEREHHTMESQWKRLHEALTAVLRGEPRLDAEEVTRFAWLYRRHMERESGALLPFARKALSDAERAALGERMAARRVQRT